MNTKLPPMTRPDALIDSAALDQFVDGFGPGEWATRISDLEREAAKPTRLGRAIQQRHIIELTIDRWRKPGRNRPPSPGERSIAELATDASRLFDALPGASRDKLRTRLRTAAEADNTLIPAFHILRTAALQRARGFDVSFAGLQDDAKFDLLIHRDGQEAEIACDVVSAEDGRGVHRGAWSNLCDRVDPELQTWLASHPGRYVLKMTLPQGLKDVPKSEALAALHGRITAMLSTSRRADHDEAAVLRLDPLMLAAAQADELGLMPRLRNEFGPEAHLAVMTAERSMMVLAARAGQENEVAIAVRRRMAAVAPTRLSGQRPAILAMFIEDTDRAEWRLLRERMDLEGEVRQFLTNPSARPVVAVTCASRLEMFGAVAPDAAPDGEFRYRNPQHPAAKLPALAPAITSSI
jgi:hypothetical protein